MKDWIFCSVLKCVLETTRHWAQSPTLSVSLSASTSILLLPTHTTHPLDSQEVLFPINLLEYISSCTKNMDIDIYCYIWTDSFELDYNPNCWWLTVLRHVRVVLNQSFPMEWWNFGMCLCLQSCMEMFNFVHADASVINLNSFLSIKHIYTN